MSGFLHNCYSSQRQGTIPLRLISKAQWMDQPFTIAENHLNWLKQIDFKGQLGQLALFHSPAGQLEMAYIGSGAGDQKMAMANAAMQLPPGRYSSSDPLTYTALLFWGLAQYQFDRYKINDRSVRILLAEQQWMPRLERDLQATECVRDLINTPANDLGPEELAQCIKDIANTRQASVEEWVGTDLLENNFPAIYAVGRASTRAPRLIHLSWGKETDPDVALVGKGVCFDSGGLDIKSSAGMRLMKKDMGGAAHAIALAEWIMAAKLPVRLHLWVVALDNAVSGDAYRPGDILTMRNALTVEIDNTDAEGRLVLADAMVKACEFNPEVMIDFATLTGAARVAVGTDIAAMFCNDDTLAAELFDSAVQEDDPLWRLPLHKGYEAMLESSVANVSNAAPSSYAGAITAALFLQRFVQDSVRWAHFDIMAWNVASQPGKPMGGEAMAIRAIAQWFERQYNHHE